MMIAILLLLMVAVSAQTNPHNVEYNGYEFSFYTNEASGQLTYDKAKQVCVDAGARLAEIKSADVQDFITTQLTDLGLVEVFSNWYQGYWVGGVSGGGGNPDGIYNWKWEDGTSIGSSNYDNWYYGGGCPFSEPNDNGGSDRLFILPFKEGRLGSQTCNGALGKWGDDDKNSKKNYICMKVILLELEFNGLWYKFYNPSDSNDRLSYGGAKAKCESENGHLAYIKDDATQQMITAQLASLNLVEDGWTSFERGYWVGAKCVDCMGGNAYKNNWKWEDGTSIGDYNYENWYNEVSGCGPAPNINKATSRGMLYSFDVYGICSSALGKWADTVDGNDAKNWICMEDLCNPNPCENGGICNAATDEYHCSCQAGFIGKNCEINLCDSNPCENGGTCNHVPGGSQCNCPDGFIGDFCQTDLCDSNICGYCGTCNHAYSRYQCNCADGFTGDNYETGIPFIYVDGVPTFNLVITRDQTQSINLTCEVNQQFNLSTTFIWMKSEDIKSGSNSLMIDNLGSADLGLYSCKTKDTLGSFATTRYLDVHYPAEQFKVTNDVNNVCEWDLDGVQSCTILFQLNPTTHNATLTKDGSIVSNDFEYLPQNSRNQQFIFRKNQPMKKDAGLYQLTITSAKFAPVIYEFTIDLIVPPKDDSATIVGVFLGSIIAICFVIIAYLLFDRNRNKNAKSTQYTRNEG